MVASEPDRGNLTLAGSEAARGDRGKLSRDAAAAMAMDPTLTCRPIFNRRLDGGAHRAVSAGRRAISHTASTPAAAFRATIRTAPCGLRFAVRKVRPTYSPRTLRIIDCTPPTSSRTTMVDAQPVGVSWRNKASIMVATAPITPNAAIAAPAKVARR